MCHEVWNYDQPHVELKCDIEVTVKPRREIKELHWGLCGTESKVFTRQMKQTTPLKSKDEIQ